MRGYLEKQLDLVQELPYLAEEGLHVEERRKDDDGNHLHEVGFTAAEPIDELSLFVKLQGVTACRLV